MCQYAVVDLEMCKVPYGAKKSKYHWKHETIQIGAVLLNESLEIIDMFSTYVLPQFGFIDTYISNLTGISIANVRNAPNMENALQKFVNWLPNGAHDGLVDAYNTALLFAKMEREPKLVLNPYYQNAISPDEASSGFTIGNLFAGIDLQSFVTA